VNFKIPPIYPIIDPQISPRPIKALVEELARAGVRLVQLREKKMSSRELFRDAQELLELSRSYRMTIIVNDRADIAWLTGAQGVHLGQEDLPLAEVRKILGPSKIIGCSTHNLDQALEAQRSTADYVAIGPIYATASKENPDPIVEWNDLKKIRQKVVKPLVAIGGITTKNAGDLFDLGIDSVAVIRDVLCAPDIGGKIEEFLKLAAH